MNRFMKILIAIVIGLQIILVIFIMFSKVEEDEGRIFKDVSEDAEIHNLVMPKFEEYGITSEMKERITGKSYKENDFIKYDDLKYLEVAYKDFEGKTQIGELIVNKNISKDVLAIFKELYDNGYKIEKMNLIDDYMANDDLSMKDNNTSAFNFRNIGDQDILSQHAYGLAIDINPLQNPYVKDGMASIEESQEYVIRENKRLGMIDKDDICVKIFKEHGWEWGGDWVSPKDYQHFERKIEVQ